MSAWTNHLKEFAKKQGITYKEAMKDPKCKETYVKPVKGEGINLVVKEIKKKGKQAKKMIGLGVETETESKTSCEEKEEKAETPKPKRRGRPPKVRALEGEGLIVKNKTENINGLGHIYPLSHQQILEMVGRG